MNQVVQMHWIVEFCVNLSMQACKIVRDSIGNNEVKKFMKGVNDPVTQADFKIQTMLSRGIKKHYPQIKIVGEEEVEYEGEISTNYEAMGTIKLPEEAKFNKKYNLNDICIWIDPIDNTRGFIEGQAEAVTVLIGISYEQKSQIGIIGLPFKKTLQKAIYDPSVLIGCVSEQFAFQYTQHQKWNKIHHGQHQKVGKPRVVMSPTRANIIQTKIVQDLSGQKMLAGGAGYKAVLIVKKQAELLAYCKSYTKKWDTAAGEAVVKALGGYFTDQFGDSLVYDPKAKSYVNRQGILCGFVSEYKQVAILRCKKEMEKIQKL